MNTSVILANRIKKLLEDSYNQSSVDKSHPDFKPMLNHLKKNATKTPFGKTSTHYQLGNRSYTHFKSGKEESISGNTETMHHLSTTAIGKPSGYDESEISEIVYTQNVDHDEPGEKTYTASVSKKDPDHPKLLAALKQHGTLVNKYGNHSEYHLNPTASRMSGKMKVAVSHTSETMTGQAPSIHHLQKLAGVQSTEHRMGATEFPTHNNFGNIHT